MAHEHFHVAGVAGVGMSAVAQALLDTGHVVTGSDRYHDEGHPLDVLDILAAAGVKMVPQDGSALTSKTAGLVVSTAIEKDNPEIAAAGRLGVPVIHRAEMIARLAKDRHVVAVTGTSGKTTVTGMIGHLLTEVGWDPFVVNGGSVLNWMGPGRLGSVRRGRSGLWIVEADESDKSLLRFNPEWAVITNISKDHFELAELTHLFADFAARTKNGVLCPPDVAAGLRQLGRKDLPPLLEQEPVIQQDGGAWFFERRGLRFDVPIIGRHNAENAFMAVQACERLGLDLAAVRDALRTFKGIHRRLERIGQGKIAVFDDYAHNPAKIAASWSAVAEVAPRVIGFWRPHGFAPLSLMMNDLAGAFAGVFRPDDRLYILPVFYAGGTASKTVNAQDLVLQLNRLRVQSEALEGYGALRDRLLALARPGDAILGMGARDPELPLFARRIAEELKQRI